MVLSIPSNNKYKYKNSHFYCTTKRKTFFFFHFYTFAHKMVKRGKTFVRSLLYEKYAQILIQTKLHAHSVFIYGNCYLLNGRKNLYCTVYLYTKVYTATNGNQSYRGDEKDFSQACKQADRVNRGRRSSRRNKLCIFIYSFFPRMKNGKHNHKLKYKKAKKKTEVQIKFIYIDQLFSIYTSLQQRECGNGKESNETQFVVCV